MSTYSVSTAAQLDKALDAARGGDKIVLAPGDYGALELQKYAPNGTVTLTSASASRPAEFGDLDLRNVSNLTFDGLAFDAGTRSGQSFRIYNADDITIRNSTFEGGLKNGYAATSGLQVLKATDVTVENSDFRNLTKGAVFIDIDGLDVRGNDVYAASIDAMVFGDVHHARIESNEVHGMKTHSGINHKDLIQFWNVSNSGGSSDVVIRNNVLESGGDGLTHGIYMGNETAQRTGSRSDFYKDILIEGNTIVSGQYHGLTVGETDGLIVRNNQVLQDPGAGKSAVHIPRIVVADKSVDVNISGNTAHMISDDGGRTWDVGGNKIVSTGHKSSKQPSPDTKADTKADEPEPAAKQTADAGSDGDGKKTTVRFDGDRVKGTDRDTVKGFDFGEGDKIVFIDYDRNTFQDTHRNANHVANNKAGTSVKIDSLADIHEIAAMSDDVGVRVRGDTLVLTIDQGRDTHHVSLVGLGESYDALF